MRRHAISLPSDSAISQAWLESGTTMQCPFLGYVNSDGEEWRSHSLDRVKATSPAPADRHPRPIVRPAPEQRHREAKTSEFANAFAGSVDPSASLRHDAGTKPNHACDMAERTLRALLNGGRRSGNIVEGIETHAPQDLASPVGSRYPCGTFRPCDISPAHLYFVVHLEAGIE